LQADVRTITALGCHAVSAITTITIQNTLGIQCFYDIPCDIVAAQIEAIVNDVQPTVIKIGMIRSVEMLNVIVNTIVKYKPKHVVFDPVISSFLKEKLMSRYEENKELVMNEVRKLLDKCNLTGQWSIDVMQNGDDFWLIDMARATESALVECVPKSKLKNVRQPFLGLEEVGVKQIGQDN